MPQLLSPDLSWQTLTTVVNKIKAPATFLQDLLFGTHVTLPTEQIEIGKLIASRKMVPFVKKGAQAYNLDFTSESNLSMEAPNIRVKKTFKPDALFFGRQVGTPVLMLPGQSQMSAVQSKISREIVDMTNRVINRIEWMCAQALEGVLSYEGTDDVESEAFEFDYNRLAGHTVVLGAGVRWNEATADIAKDVRTAADAVMEETGQNITDAILGSEAADAFLGNEKVQAIVERRRPEEGTPLMLGGRPAPNGARFLGNIFNVNWWAYPRTVVELSGSPVALVNAKKCFFVCQAAGNALYFGAIPDMKAFAGGVLQSERFSKAWETEDPSVLNVLVHTRPFPVLPQPEAFFEYQVVA